jgi:hypothetical protein
MRRIAGVIGGIALAIVLSQFPEYAQQYAQRLGGAVDELRIITEDFDKAATEAGLTREQALARYSATGDRFIEGRGLSMAQTLARYEKLGADLVLIRSAGPLDRVMLLPRFLDSDVGAKALADYKPAVPVTIEGLAWAGAGFVIGYLIVATLFRLILLPFRRRHPRALAPVRIDPRA